MSHRFSNPAKLSRYKRALTSRRFKNYFIFEMIQSWHQNIAGSHLRLQSLMGIHTKWRSNWGLSKIKFVLFAVLTLFIIFLWNCQDQRWEAHEMIEASYCYRFQCMLMLSIIFRQNFCQLPVSTKLGSDRTKLNWTGPDGIMNRTTHRTTDRITVRITYRIKEKNWDEKENWIFKTQNFAEQITLEWRTTYCEQNVSFNDWLLRSILAIYIQFSEPDKLTIIDTSSKSVLQWKISIMLFE